jgi:hypothetical protein
VEARYKVFQSSFSSWQVLFDQAAAFASALGPDRLIDIAHSESHTGNGVVVIWYWDIEQGEDWQGKAVAAEEEVERLRAEVEALRRRHGGIDSGGYLEVR